MPRFPSRKEKSVLDYIDVPLAPPSGRSFGERLAEVQPRRSDNFSVPALPWLHQHDQLEPVANIIAQTRVAWTEFTRPTLGPKPELSLAMERALEWDRALTRQRQQPSPSGEPENPPMTREQWREERKRAREFPRSPFGSDAELEALARRYVAEIK